MLALARTRVGRAGLDHRIRFECRTLPGDHLRARRFDAIVSNSLLHHLASPLVLWETVAACARSNAPILVMDLLRPPDIATFEALVQRYAGDSPAVPLLVGAIPASGGSDDVANAPPVARRDGPSLGRARQDCPRLRASARARRSASTVFGARNFCQDTGRGSGVETVRLSYRKDRRATGAEGGAMTLKGRCSCSAIRYELPSAP